MKNLLFVLLFINLLFVSCSKEEEPVQPTTLELFVKDAIGNSVEGAIVKLYSSQADWINETNQKGSTQVSDASGKVKFTDLSTSKYYWLIEKGCQNNVNGANTTTDNLTANVNNTVNVVLSQTGALMFNNTSSNPYRVFINGQAVFEMNGNTSRPVGYLPVGNYTLRVLQLSGYAVYPTDQTYTTNLSCGDVKTLTFPQ